MEALKENGHIGCIVLFILAAVAFVIFSIPRLKEMEARQNIEKERRDSAALERAWEIADSVKRESLLEDPDYMELLEEIDDLKDSIRRIKEK